MTKGILGIKVGMTQIWNEQGILIPVTVVEAGPCVVTQIKTKEIDGYEAIKVGFKDVRENLINKPDKGQFKKAGCSVKRYLKEFKFDNVSEYQLNQEIKADIFEVGDNVDVTGTSKGKGYQGVIKRLGQHRGPMKHGSKFHRHQGSNGPATTPGRVRKGKGMPGQMGHETVTTQNLEIVMVDPVKNLIAIKGAIPGPDKSLVTIKQSVKKKVVHVTQAIKEKPISKTAPKVNK